MRYAALTVALLLVTAGCNAFPGGGAATVETTSVDDVTTRVGSATTETTGGDAEDAVESRLAPGLNEDGITDPQTLTEAHASVLRNTSYTVSTNLTVSENGTVAAYSNSTVKVAQGGTPLVSRYEVDGDHPESVALVGHDIEAWADENETLYAMERPNGTVYQRVSADERPPPRTQGGSDHLYLLFIGLDTTVTGTETQNGTTYYRVNSTGIADSEILAGTLRTETVENASLSALVSEDGLILEYLIAYDGRARTEYQIAYDGGIENATISVERTVRFTALGETTVERPPWYDEAVNATDESE